MLAHAQVSSFPSWRRSILGSQSVSLRLFYRLIHRHPMSCGNPGTSFGFGSRFQFELACESCLAQNGMCFLVCGCRHPWLFPCWVHFLWMSRPFFVIPMPCSIPIPGHSMAPMTHRTHHRNHLVHHVMWKMAMQHPFAHDNSRRIRYHVPVRLQQDGIAGRPWDFRNASTLSSRCVKGVAMQVHRMMIHPHIHKPDPHTLPFFNDEWSACRSRDSIQSQPVEFHRGSVGYRIVWQ